jgi:hypothetical protein
MTLCAHCDHADAEVILFSRDCVCVSTLLPRLYLHAQYFALHPGGEAILRNAGRDSTAGFSGSQHPARVWDMVRPIAQSVAIRPATFTMRMHGLTAMP